jgi:hypothetical protein
VAAQETPAFLKNHTPKVEVTIMKSKRVAGASKRSCRMSRVQEEVRTSKRF